MFMPYPTNKNANQPAHSCSLISTFVRCLDCIISIYHGLGWFESYRVRKPLRTGFLVTRLGLQSGGAVDTGLQGTIPQLHQICISIKKKTACMLQPFFCSKSDFFFTECHYTYSVTHFKCICLSIFLVMTG